MRGRTLPPDHLIRTCICLFSTSSFGQQKQCYVYRLVTDNSMERRIYDRQVKKQSMSNRIVDETNPENMVR